MREKETREEYLKRYREEHKGAISAYNADYWEKNSARLKRMRERPWYCPYCHFDNPLRAKDNAINISGKSRHLRSKKHKRNVKIYKMNKIMPPTYDEVWGDMKY